MASPSEIQGPGGMKETLPGQAPTDLTQGQAGSFQLYGDSSPYPSRVGKALEEFLYYGAQQWKNSKDNLYYQVIPSGTKSTKSDLSFYTSIYIYKDKPGKGVTPIASYPKAYWVDEKIGEFQNQYYVYYMAGGQKIPDPSLDYTPPPHSIPSNFAEFKKMDPKLFKQFYEAFVYQIAMLMMKQLRQNQAKMKQAMQGEV